MTIRNEIQQLILATQQHLREEENLPHWEVCDPSTLSFYKNPTTKTAIKQPPPPPAKPLPLPQATVKPTLAPPPIPAAKAVMPPPSLIETKTAPPPPKDKNKNPINHEMFKSLCKELFPDLVLLENSDTFPSRVILVYDSTATDKGLLFLEKIAEALRARGIETTLTTAATFIPSSQALVLADSKTLPSLPAPSQSPILSLEDLDLLAEDTVKKKLLWQQLRTLLGI